MMRNVIIGFLLFFLLAGCKGRESTVPSPAGVSSPAEVSSPAVEPDNAPHQATKAPRRYMAYEHSVSLHVENDKVAPLQKSVEAACQQAVADECVILQSNFYVGEERSADIKLRAKPEGIKKIISTLITQGNVTRQSVTAEDLAEPIEDSAKRLKILKDNRSQLETLRGKAGGDVESLIKISKELAEVQGSIEALSGEQAQLYRRVQTELLDISISSQTEDSFWGPVGNALAHFTRNLADGISITINALSYLLPSAMLFTALWLGIRKLRARKK